MVYEQGEAGQGGAGQQPPPNANPAPPAGQGDEEGWGNASPSYVHAVSVEQPHRTLMNVIYMYVCLYVHKFTLEQAATRGSGSPRAEIMGSSSSSSINHRHHEYKEATIFTPSSNIQIITKISCISKASAAAAAAAHTHIHTHTHTHTHTCIHTRLPSPHVYIYIYRALFTCIYIWFYIYTTAYKLSSIL